MKRIFSHSLVRWGLLSAGSFCLNFTTTVVSHEVLGFSEELAFLCGLIATFIVNFFLMRFLVFNAATVPIRLQFAGYAAAQLGFRGLEYFAYYVLLNGIGIPYYAALALVLPTSSLGKYLFYRGTFFANRRDGQLGGGVAGDASSQRSG